MGEWLRETVPLVREIVALVRLMLPPLTFAFVFSETLVMSLNLLPVALRLSDFFGEGIMVLSLVLIGYAQAKDPLFDRPRIPAPECIANHLMFAFLTPKQALRIPERRILPLKRLITN
jgi:hypothetical protein